MNIEQPSSNIERPLRILHLTLASDAGGLSRYIYDLSVAMHEQGHQIAVAGERGAWHWLFEQAPFPWIETPMKGGYLSARKSARILNRWIDKNPVDVLHVHYRRSAMVGRQIQKTHRIPMLYTLHLSDLNVRWPWSLITDFGDRTHVASVHARDWAIREAKVPAKNMVLLPHGIDPEKFPVTTGSQRIAARKAFGLGADDLVAVFVGRLEPPKNEEWIIDLAERSRDRLAKLKVLLVGEGPNEQSLHQRIKEQNLESCVKIFGHRDPLPVYQSADALLLPSLREGFSFVCAEAMSTGIPAFRTRTAGTEELIIENQTGRSVPIDRQAFIEGAMKFLSDPAELKRMGAIAANHVRVNFTFQRQLEGTIAMYRSIIAAETHNLSGRR